MNLLNVLCFVAWVAAVPHEQSPPLVERAGGRLAIGYRAFRAAEATSIKNNGYKAVQSLGIGGQQLGPGLYISSQFGIWKPNDETLWDCILETDADYWNELKKAWIPQYSIVDKDTPKCRRQILWGDRGNAPAFRESYLRSNIDPIYTPANTVKFGWISIHHFRKMQMVLPPAVIDSGNIYIAKCFPRANKEKNAAIDIGSLANVWNVKNIRGYNEGFTQDRFVGSIES